jgi:hypothetical protein
VLPLLFVNLLTMGRCMAPGIISLPGRYGAGTEALAVAGGEVRRAHPRRADQYRRVMHA